MLSLLLFAATCFLAYSNGANDNFKGVASLLGSDTANYPTAITWGTITTFLGSVASVFLASALLSAFSGKGLVPDSVAGGEAFLLAIAVGAGATVILAAILGFPISTTHGLVGAILGAGLIATHGNVKYGVLATTFLIPLLVSPLLAVAVAGPLWAAFHYLRQTLGIEKDTCVCVGEPVRALVSVGGGVTALARSETSLDVAVNQEERCKELYVGQFLGVSWQGFTDVAHYLSAGIVSFARGLNDTPKIAALLLVIRFVDIQWGLILLGVAMALGGLLNAHHVANTMGRRITGMNAGQGLAANLTTGSLVIGASLIGMPVSTTHVSVGSLFGIGLATGKADLRVVRNIGFAWIITVPCAAIVAALSYWLVA